jgi:hypothetical protein
MKVTPDRDAPIMPYATTNHGDILLPIKNDWLSAFRAVIQVTVNSTRVYTRNNPSIKIGDISESICLQEYKKKGRQKIPETLNNTGK